MNNITAKKEGEGIADWTTSINGVVNVPDGLDPLLKKTIY